MSDFAYEDFRRVAKEVADHISEKGGFSIEDSWDTSKDCTWASKAAYVDQVFRRFFRVVFLADKERYGWKNKSALITTMEHPNVTALSVEPKPFYSSEPTDKLNTLQYLKVTLESFLSDYIPPNENRVLADHLRVLQIFYTEISKHLKGVSPSIPQRIDLAMAKATGIALEKIGFITRTAIKSLPRTNKSSQTKRAIWASLDIRIKSVIDSLSLRDGLSGRSKARIIQAKWEDHYPNETPPSTSKLQQFFKDHELEVSKM